MELNRECNVKFDDKMLLKIENFHEFDLLVRLLEPSMHKRIFVEEALNHEYFHDIYS